MCLYIVKELIGAAVTHVNGRDKGDKKQIKPNDLTLGARYDMELNRLLRKVIIPCSGKMEWIHPALKNGKKRKKKKESKM